MKTQPSHLQELEDGRWELEQPTGSGKKTIYNTLDEAEQHLISLSYNKISHYKVPAMGTLPRLSG